MGSQFYLWIIQKFIILQEKLNISYYKWIKEKFYQKEEPFSRVRNFAQYSLNDLIDFLGIHLHNQNL